MEKEEFVELTFSLINKLEECFNKEIKEILKDKDIENDLFVDLAMSSISSLLLNIAVALHHITEGKYDLNSLVESSYKAVRNGVKTILKKNEYNKDLH